MRDEVRVPLQVRASSAHRWLSCPAKAAHERRASETAPLKGEPVASVFGSMVHGELTGHEFEMPRAILFDRVTRNRQELDRQVDDAVYALGMHLRDVEVEAMELELSATVELATVPVNVTATGHIDLMLRYPDAVRAIGDLKTGLMDPHYAMIQMGIYSLLAAANDFEAEEVVVIAFGRGWKKDAEVREVRRPAPLLADLGKDIIRHLGFLSLAPAPFPGLVCHGCENQGCIAHPEWKEETP